jgi:Zn-dependent M28 family amino/carboxypeptidase
MGPPVEDRLRAHVETLAGDIGSRGLRRGAALRRTLVYLEEALDEMGYAVQRETYAVDAQEATNLWVEVRGTERADEIVVIGAHYDSVPSTPGADDNASGVAATLELARAFADRPQAQTIRFVFFGNEEPPYFQTDAMGSLVHARAMAAANLNVTSMASLEMLGYFSDEPGSQEVPLGLAGLFPDMGNFVAFVSDIPSSSVLDEAHAAFMGSSGFPAEKLAAPGTLPEAGFSDHWSFWQANFRAIMVTDTAFFRNPHYHEPTDTVDTLDYVRFGQLFPGLVGMVEALAD